MLDRKSIIFGVLSIFFLALTIWLERTDNRVNNLQQYTSVVQKNLQVHENQIADILQKFNENPDFLERSDKFQAAIGKEDIKDLSSKPYTVLLFEGEKLVSWSNNRAIVDISIKEGFMTLNEGYYSVQKKSLPRNFQAVCLIPIKWNYKLTNEQYLKNQFIASEEIPHSVTIATQSTPFEITCKSGNSIFLDANDKASNKTRQSQLFIIVFLGLFFICLTVSNVAAYLRNHKGQGGSILFFLSAAAAIKILITYFDFNSHFHLLPLFEYSISQKSILNTTPSDILTNIMLILWLIVYLYRDAKMVDFDSLKFWHKIIINTVIQMTMSLGLLMVIYFHQELGKSKSNNFDFENLFYIDFGGLVTILSLLMLWIVLFLFNYRLMSNIKKINLPFVYRMSTLVTAIILLFPLITRHDFQINYAIIVVLIFAYYILNDFFSDNYNDLELVWTITWLIFYAATSTCLLYNYRRIADIDTLTLAVQKLSFGKDTKAIERIDQLVETFELSRDTVNTYENTQKSLSTIFNRDNYLFDNYRFILLDTLVKATSTKTRAVLDSSGTMTYTAQIPVDSSSFYRLEVIKIQKPNSIADEYKNSVWAEPYLDIPLLDKMEYVVFKNKQIIEQKGNVYSQFQKIDRIPKIGTTKLEQQNLEYSEVVGHFENDVVIVGRFLYNGIDKIISLFAYLFICMSGIVFFLGIANRSSRTIEDFRFAPVINMKVKVHMMVIFLLVFICIIIAGVTFIFSNTSTDARHTEQLQQKLSSVASDVIFELERTTDNAKIDMATLTALMKSIHQVDVNFYNEKGLLFSNVDDIVFKKHLKAPLINSYAFHKLMNEDYQTILIQDKIGEFAFQSGYARIEKDGELFGLLEVPNYSREDLKKKDISDLMGRLITFYVLLLIPTLVFANQIAKLIMEPLKEVGRKLREVEFGLKPTKIEWDSKDELGGLINEYNIMLHKLDESARAIKENAQENAWRTMAKQVCHDIRNPLTPMNLTVQMIAMYSNTMSHEDLKAYIVKSSRLIEEQIIHLDNLAMRFGEYAGELTNDGKPKLVIEDIEFCDFVDMNASLFQNNANNTTLNIVLPKEEIFVRFDKAQMTRVLNNLMKNAIEAIPEHREGRVDVFVYKVEDGKVQLRISDNGVGIPQEQMTKIFQPNFTTKGTGSGIGLAVCNRIVKDVNGKIWCESILGQGADFFIEFPIHE